MPFDEYNNYVPGYANYQLGQCRILVERTATEDFYKKSPKITENCKCSNCEYFEKIVVEKDIRFFKILKAMHVDLTRQPNIHPDGICRFGETEKYKHGFMGNYFVIGRITKSQLKSKQLNDNGEIESVEFFETEEDSTINYKIIQVEDEKLSFEFLLQCEKK